jgi:hypothetical protein
LLADTDPEPSHDADGTQTSWLDLNSYSSADTYITIEESEE